MAAGIAHELNQPLVSVRGAAEHMLIGIEEGWDVTPDRLTEKLNLIVDQADRMVHIIEHVRLFAREAGQPSLSPVDIAEVVCSSVDLVGAQFRSQGVRLESNALPGLPPVNVNPYSLEEVFLNLLVNARDAVEDSETSDGMVTVTASAAEDRSRVLVEVQDNGSGIPQDVLEKMWDPFFTTKDPE